MDYRYLGSIFRGPLTGVTIGYYPTQVPLLSLPGGMLVDLAGPTRASLVAGALVIGGLLAFGYADAGGPDLFVAGCPGPPGAVKRPWRSPQ
jgi:hypothetical protein